MLPAIKSLQLSLQFHTHFQKIYAIITCGGCPKFFPLETAILSQKKIYFSQTFAILTKKLSRGPYVGLYLGIFVRKQKLDKGHLRV